MWGGCMSRAWAWQLWRVATWGSPELTLPPREVESAPTVKELADFLDCAAEQAFVPEAVRATNGKCMAGSIELSLVCRLGP
jgi:hypothetical protein